MAPARRRIVLAGCVFAAALRSTSVSAQEPVVIRSNVLLYGDNTEFHNPFRKGETIFGAAVRLTAAIGLNDHVTLEMGGFGNQRFGSENAFEQARPVVSLTVHGDRSAIIFGTFPAPALDAPFGPDRNGPHALLPPLQRETLAYDRPYEAGLAWNFIGSALQHRFWLEWQRLNTPDHRERFDGGFNELLRVTGPVSLPVQLHVVHQGGQLYASGPVADSAAAAAGVDVHGAVAAHFRASLELFGLVSRFVPDRSRPDLSRDGGALFARASVERSDWRGHLIIWRGRNFIKDEGDANYMSAQLALPGAPRYRGTRDYAEVGLTRRFALAPSALLEASGRFHRVENHYEYSYRVLSIVSPSWRIH